MVSTTCWHWEESGLMCIKGERPCYDHPSIRLRSSMSLAYCWGCRIKLDQYLHKLVPTKHSECPHLYAFQLHLPVYRLSSCISPAFQPNSFPAPLPLPNQIGPQVKWPLSVWPNLRFESVRTLLHGHEVPCQVPSSANFIHPNYLEFRSTPYPNCKNLMGVQNATCFRLTIHNLQEFEYHSSLPPPAFRRNG